MKQRDLRDAAKTGIAVAIGRPIIRGERPSSLRRARVLKFPVRPGERVARIRYEDNGTVDTVSVRDVFAPWTSELESRRLVVEPGDETETKIAHISLTEIFVDYADTEGHGYQRQRSEEEALQIAMAPNRHRWAVEEVHVEEVHEARASDQGGRIA